MALQGFRGDRSAYDKAIAMAKSTKAKEILTYLQDASRAFDVVVIPNGSTYGQMLTEQDRSSPEVLVARAEYQRAFNLQAPIVIARPTVFWCADYRFEYYGDVVGCVSKPNGDMTPIVNVAQLRPGDFYLQYTTTLYGKASVFKVPVVRYTKAFMEPWIVLLHELGHVKQYFEGGADPASWDRAWSVRLGDTDGIEADNLSRHENPVCREAGIAIRQHYKHMANGMGGINQAFASPKKAPALRVANSPGERVKLDSELLYAAKYNQLHKKADGYYVV